MVTSLLSKRSAGSRRRPDYGGFRRLAYSLTGLLLALSSSFASVQAQTTTLNYTGAAQTYTVPAGVTRLQVTARGAGVSTGGAPVASSLGAVVEATITVTPGEVLNVYVGGTATFVGGFSGNNVGGYNGGGNGSSFFYPNGSQGGGGATDLRRGGSALANRIVVAGGGGGAGAWGSNAGGTFPGGAGGHGGQTGGFGTGSSGAGGASQSAGGLGADVHSTSDDGTLGQGGNSVGGGGGGGGYYGGGGAGGTAGVSGGGGGGGGSSYVAPAVVAAGTTPSYSSANSGAGSIVLTPVIPMPTVSSFAPSAGPVGTTVTITGTNFSGATAVSFNGTAATGFTVNSATSITATVPTGATSGPIAVTTPGGTATSASSFGILTAGPTTTISYTGTPQTYTVPAGITRLQVTAQGAGTTGGSGFGRGALVTATLSVVPGEVLTLVAGGIGFIARPNDTQPPAGGYNGGGAGGNPASSPAGNVSNNPGGGGAGATDVRRIVGANSGSPLAGGSLVSTLSRRLLVAGGAGGAGVDAGTPTNIGPIGGAGGAGTTFGGGTGGSFGSAYTAAAGEYGTLGQGGRGGNGTTGGGGYGGGGGYYGGGGGSGTVSNFQQWGPGGGGSSYVEPTAVPSGYTPSYALAAQGGPVNGSLTLTPVYESPTLTSFSPTSGPTGTSVTLTGTNLAGATAVSFNGTAAMGFTVNSATSITATVPTGATSGTISVTTPGGTATSSASFTVTPPAPIISNFSPGSGPEGSVFTINGANFTGTTSVTVNGTSALFSVNSATQLNVVVPRGATSGPVQVTTPNGTTTSASPFTVLPAPVIYSFSPSSGPVGTVVTINGDNFNGTQLVAFTGSAGTVAAQFTVNSPTRITATVPAGATTGYVALHTGGYSSTSPTAFTVTASVPTISSFTPDSGPVGTSVTITGTNFTGATAVSFNGTSAPGFVVNSATSITVTVPSGATSGAISVTTPGGTATSGSTFTVSSDLTVSSAQNISGSYQNVTITGTGAATLTGPLTVSGTLTVQSGGSLTTSCQPISGSGSFVLQPEATLSICDAQGISASGSTGAIRLTGSRSFSPEATYLYNGGVAQVTGSGLPATVRNLTLNNAASLALSQPLALSRMLTLTSGRLNTNGQPLTLLSNASGTAMVVNVGGDVGGNVTVQRYISPALNAGSGYRHLASPVQNTAVADLATGSFSPVVNPAYNSSATPNLVTPFPTVFGYDQARQTSSPATSYSIFDKGWFSPGSPTDALQVGRGYTVNLAGGLTPDFVGILNNGPQTLTFTRTTGPEAGWQLVGNPYPAPLDWGLVARADRPGLSGAMYVYESTAAYAGRYRSYINGIGNPVLPLGQAFFVRVADSSSTGTLIFRNSQRLTTPDATPLLRGTPDLRPQLQLSLRGAGTRDDAYVYAEAGATAGVEAEFDARKLPNATGLNLAVLAGTTPLAIAGVAPFTATTVLPLQVQVPTPGAYTLQTEQLLNFAPGAAVYLRDAQTGQDQLLTAQAGYPFTLTTTSAGSRFSLVFRPGGVTATGNAQLAGQLAVYPNPTQGSFTLLLPAAGLGSRAEAVLYNALGQAVQRRTLPLAATGLRTEWDATRLPAGVYTLRLTLADGTQLTKRVVKH